MKNITKTIILALTLLSVSVFADMININTATKAELMSLEGVGETKAEAIMKHRKKSKFKSLADIKDVNGIGDKIYKDNSRKMKLSGKTEITESTAKPKLSEAKKKKAKAKSKAKSKSKK